MSHSLIALRAAKLSLFVGFLVLALKWAAYYLTGSVALYSDALESFVNIAAAGAAFIALRVAHQPADRDHPYGHTKAEYFSAVLEGGLILVAALMIINEAWGRLFQPLALESTAVGMAVSLLASALNAGLAWYLLRIAKQTGSPAIRADGLHILSDVVTSAGVLLGIGLAWLSHYWILDPLLAILVALNILWMGVRLLRESMGGLMDEALPAAELEQLQAYLHAAMTGAIQIHALKTRRAGQLVFAEFHLVVPGEMPVREAHAICDRLEAALQQALPTAVVTIHVEPEMQAE